MTSALRGAGHLGDAAGVGDQSEEGIHGEDVQAADISMPIVATAVPKTPLLNPGTPAMSAWEPRTKEITSARPMVMAVAAVVSYPTAVPMMMFVAGPVLEASAIS